MESSSSSSSPDSLDSSSAREPTRTQRSEYVTPWEIYEHPARPPAHTPSISLDARSMVSYSSSQSSSGVRADATVRMYGRGGRGSKFRLQKEERETKSHLQRNIFLQPSSPATPITPAATFPPVKVAQMPGHGGAESKSPLVEIAPTTDVTHSRSSSASQGVPGEVKMVRMPGRGGAASKPRKVKPAGVPKEPSSPLFIARLKLKVKKKKSNVREKEIPPLPTSVFSAPSNSASETDSSHSSLHFAPTQPPAWTALGPPVPPKSPPRLTIPPSASSGYTLSDSSIASTNDLSVTPTATVTPSSTPTTPASSTLPTPTSSARWQRRQSKLLRTFGSGMGIKLPNLEPFPSLSSHDASFDGSSRRSSQPYVDDQYEVDDHGKVSPMMFSPPDNPIPPSSSQVEMKEDRDADEDDGEDEDEDEDEDEGFCEEDGEDSDAHSTEFPISSVPSSLKSDSGARSDSPFVDSISIIPVRRSMSLAIGSLRPTSFHEDVARNEEKQGWSGRWNQKNMQEVVSRLRELR